VRTTFNVFASFWKGMGNVFTSVVTLIVASEVFSKGLIGLGFIDSLVGYSSHIGLSGLAIAAIFTLIIFGAAMLMGSGNAAFFSFGPLLPGIATQLGLPVFSLILPLQLAASMGRAASPIAGVIVAIAGVAGVSSVELARRNTFPLIGGIVFLILYHLITF
jgi:DcuC family C4-dicarboxylate transporter